MEEFKLVTPPSLRLRIQEVRKNRLGIRPHVPDHVVRIRGVLVAGYVLRRSPFNVHVPVLPSLARRVVGPVGDKRWVLDEGEREVEKKGGREKRKRGGRGKERGWRGRRRNRER